MNLNGWEYYELEKEMGNSNFAQLLELFKRESKKYLDGCNEYVKNLSNLNKEGKEKLESELNFIAGGKLKIGLRIAEIMTDTTMIQNEIRPKRG